MESSGQLKAPSVPGTPLQQLSPDRINQQRIPQSPSLPVHLAKVDNKHHRQSSDVQSRVAYLNSLHLNSSPTKQPSSNTHAALQRAFMGREEAEANLASTTAQLAEAQTRERRICERVETLMEELQTQRERQAHERDVFEKEVRRARKEAFKAGSTLVKIQEELKDARTEVKTLRNDLHHEKQGREKSKQEAFERAYTLAGIMEEVESMREKMKTLESERDGLMLQMQAQLVQPKSQKDTLVVSRETQTHGSKSDDGSVSTSISGSRSRKNRFSRMLSEQDRNRGSRFINWGVRSKSRAESDWTDPNDDEEEPDLEDQLFDLQEELRWERKLRERADDLIEFMHMECQFKRCSCRIAEANGEVFIHDHAYEAKRQRLLAEKAIAESIEPEAVPLPADETETDALEDSETTLKQHESPIQVAGQTPEATLRLEEMTQVLVEADTRRQAFCFSASTSSAKLSAASAFTLRLDQRSTSVDHDLFDFSPPKTAPARPQTALGLMDVPHLSQRVSLSFTPLGLTYANARRVELKDSIQDEESQSYAPFFNVSPERAPFPTTPLPRSATRMLPRTQTTTTTTMVPLRGMDTDDVFSPAPPTPGTPISREAALAQIKARRDRARSLNLKTSIGSGGAKSAPGSPRKLLGVGLPSVDLTYRGRDFSQASAPGRMGL